MPRLRSSATTAGDTTATMTCAAPDDIAAGDLLLAFVTGSQSTGAATTSYTAPGWDPAAFFGNGGNSLQPASAVLVRTATASEPSSWPFTRHGTTDTDQLIAHLLAVADVDPAAPFAAGPIHADTPRDQAWNPVPAPGVAIPDGTPALLITAHIAMFWYGAIAGNRWAPPAGMTEATDYGGPWAQMSTHHAEAGAATTGTRASALSEGPNQEGRGITVALAARTATTPGQEPGRLLLATV